MGLLERLAMDKQDVKTENCIIFRKDDSGNTFIKIQCKNLDKVVEEVTISQGNQITYIV